ncbi:MAG: hypothetical protein KAG96_04840 [Ichthyobacteriaceae bacterium]|nr:hypothetical protein [Ichthyobacteriaceae bacterium]
MKINKIAMLLLLASSTLVGQEITKLNINGYHAKFAEEGKILVTSSNFQGLKVVDVNSKEEIVLSDKARAGKSEFVNGKIYFGNKKSATSVNIDGTETKTVNRTRKTSLLEVASKANKNLNKNSVKQLVEVKSIEKLTALELVYSDGTSKVIKPLKNGARYLQSLISPNKKYILVKQYGGNGYLMKVNGTDVIDLGYMESPAWAGNDEITFQVTKDDSDKITASDIFKVNIYSRVKKNLTAKFSKIAMDPSSNNDGSKIIFNTTDGEVYIISE